MKKTSNQELKRLLMVTLFSLTVMLVINVLAMIARILTEFFICQSIIFLFIIMMVDWKTDEEGNIKKDRRSK